MKSTLTEPATKINYRFRAFGALLFLFTSCAVSIEAARELSQFLGGDELAQLFDDGEIKPGESLPENWVQTAYGVLNEINNNTIRTQNTNTRNQTIFITAGSKRYPDFHPAEFFNPKFDSGSYNFVFPIIAPISDEFISISNKCSGVVPDIGILQNLLISLDSKDMKFDATNLTGEVWQEKILEIYEDDRKNAQIRTIDSYTIMDVTSSDYPSGRVKVSKTSFSQEPDNPIFMLEQYSQNNGNWVKSGPEIEFYTQYIYESISDMMNGTLCPSPIS